MNKNFSWKIISIITIIICLLYFFIINSYTPIMGEDFALAVFSKKHVDVNKVDMLKFVIIKIRAQMQNWNVRIGEQLSIIFSCFDKTLFNLYNSAIAILFFWLAYKYAFKRKLFWGKKLVFYCLLIFMLVIMFQPALGEIFFWRTGSTNYLWASCILLFWGLPIRYYIGYESIDIIGNSIFKTIFFTVLGFFAGFTNENTVLIFLLLYVGVILNRKFVRGGGYSYMGSFNINFILFRSYIYVCGSEY